MPKFCQGPVDSRCSAYISAALFTVTAVSFVSLNTEAGWLAVEQATCIWCWEFDLLSVQVFCFTISALLYCDGNTIVSALESLYQLLLSVDAEFEGWLLSTNLPMQVTKLHSVYIMGYFWVWNRVQLTFGIVQVNLHCTAVVMIHSHWGK